MSDFNDLRTQLKNSLDKKRFYHSLGVSDTACALAMRYGYDMDKARIAGLLHDCARFIPVDKMISKAQKHDIPISKEEMANPILLHAKLGVLYAKRDYGINDEEILGSIRWHTTGKADMSILEKIIYIADYIEPGRDKQPGLAEVRKLAFEDLDKCMARILGDTLNYLSGRDRAIDSMTNEAYKFYEKYGSK